MTTQTTTQLDPLPENGTLVRLARLVLRHRKAVVAVWFVLLLAGAAAAPRVADRLSFDFALPGEPGYETAKDIIRTYGNGAEQAPSIAVVTVPPGETVAADAPAVAKAFGEVRARLPQLRVVDLAATHDPQFVTNDGRTTFALVFGPRGEGFGSPAAGVLATNVLEKALPPGFAVSATGLAPASLPRMTRSGSGRPSMRALAIRAGFGRPQSPFCFCSCLSKCRTSAIACFEAARSMT